jgi:hypothetical protein
MDDKFQGVASDIRGVRRDVGRSADDIRGLGEGHRYLRDKLEGIDDRVEELSGKINVDTQTGEVHVHKEP